jgi:hypothetical protein
MASIAKLKKGSLIFIGVINVVRRHSLCTSQLVPLSICTAMEEDRQTTGTKIGMAMRKGAETGAEAAGGVGAGAGAASSSMQCDRNSTKDCASGAIIRRRRASRVVSLPRTVARRRGIAQTTSVLAPWLVPGDSRNEITHLYKIICLSDFAAADCRFGASARTGCLHLPLATQPPHTLPPATADYCFGASALSLNWLPPPSPGNAASAPVSPRCV